MPFYAAMARRFRDVATAGVAVWEPVALDEVHLDLTGQQRTFPNTQAFCEDLRARVKGALGLSCSVGAATGRTMAEVACELLAKPGGVALLPPDQAQTLLAPRAVSVLPGRVAVGFALQEAALRRTPRLPLVAFDAEDTHDLIRRVADGADTRGAHLTGDALDIIGALPQWAANAVAAALVLHWLPAALLVAGVLLAWRSTLEGGRMRRFDVDTTMERRRIDYLARILTAREHAAETRLWGLGPELLRRWEERFRGQLRQSLALRTRNAVEGASGSSVLLAGVLAGAAIAVAAYGRHIQPGAAAVLSTSVLGVAGGAWGLSLSGRRFVEHAGYAADLRAVLEQLHTEEPAQALRLCEAGSRTVPAFGTPCWLSDGLRLCFLPPIGGWRPKRETDSPPQVVFRSPQKLGSGGHTPAGRDLVAISVADGTRETLLEGRPVGDVFPALGSSALLWTEPDAADVRSLHLLDPARCSHDICPPALQGGGRHSVGGARAPLRAGPRPHCDGV